MTHRIKNTYNTMLEQAVNLKEGLQALFSTINKIKTAEIRVDIDQISLNRAIEFRIREIENDIDFKVEGNKLDLINSKFVGTPFKKLEKYLGAFEFIPIQKQQLVDIERLFKQSKILKPEHFDVDFLVEILPSKFAVSKAQLLYQHTSEIQEAKKEF